MIVRWIRKYEPDVYEPWIDKFNMELGASELTDDPED